MYYALLIIIIKLLLGDHDSLHASTNPPGNSIVLSDLVDPSLSGSARSAFPLVVERQVDVAVERLVRRGIL